MIAECLVKMTRELTLYLQNCRKERPTDCGYEVSTPK